MSLIHMLFRSMLILGLSIGGSAQHMGSLVPPTKGGNVGDIAYDEKLDNKTFRLCNEAEVFQHYSVKAGGKQDFKNRIIERIGNLSVAKKVTGYATVRFVVNCEGKADRFRVLGVDHNYDPYLFDPAFTKAITELTKNSGPWMKATFEGSPVDYYQIVTFRIVESRVVEVLP